MDLISFDCNSVATNGDAETGLSSLLFGTSESQEGQIYYAEPLRILRIGLNGSDALLKIYSTNFCFIALSLQNKSEERPFCYQSRREVWEMASVRRKSHMLASSKSWTQLSEGEAQLNQEPGPPPHLRLQHTFPLQVRTFSILIMLWTQSSRPLEISIANLIQVLPSAM